ncbi:MAG: glycoside hydrolase [Gammaproteobacteria bacterium]|nr:glycoside hydrolase [Gammaproteobacteria bacterium]
MSADEKLDVVLCWHMHQPEYRDPTTGAYSLPWTYLHAIKDYVDMAAHLEKVPGSKAVVNFTPTLLEQIDDYARQISAFEVDGEPLRDPLLAALVCESHPEDPEQRMVLVRNAVRANEERMIRRFPHFRGLARVAKWLGRHPESAIYVNDQYLSDLLVWYHLAWMGESVRRDDSRISRLMEKGSGYTVHERRLLLRVIGELISAVVGRYRDLARSGRVELSVTPFAHPIVPLLLDLETAHEAMPDAPLPELGSYPGGEDRARWHIDRGIECFRGHFGFDPAGCWPSEGSVSDAAVTLLEQAGFEWVATGQNVLRNSMKRAALAIHDGDCLHAPYRIGQGKMRCMFRDDGLSDLIGFSYATWHADDAVANLLTHLEHIAEACAGREDGLVSIILDGENAWEHYPENGYYFLTALYRELSEHPRIRLTTFSEFLDRGTGTRELPGLVSGSWVYGTFSTWIGDSEKNRGWDMLIEAKRIYDKVLSGNRLSAEQREEAEYQLAVCEGSDWFWWFGDYNDAESVSNFERLYRHHLNALYRILGEPPPEYLSKVFTEGHGSPVMGGAMRPGRES